MFLGHIMETGDTKTIFNNPLHPYTQSLLSAVLDLDVDSTKKRIILKGEVPSPIDVPSGCPFCTRCPKAGERCRQGSRAISSPAISRVRCDTGS